MSATYILTFSCSDGIGIIASVTAVLAEHGCFVSRSRSFGDEETGHFYLRLHFAPTRDDFDMDAFLASFDEVARELTAEYAIHPLGEKLKTLILVSRSDHCAQALLYGARTGELAIDPVAIVSNHHTLGPALSHWGLPYHQIPVTPDTKASAEARLFELIEDTGAELVVLARYMQVLSDSACRQLAGRCINIHHSFLPSFKGARPYHQAYARGVKVIGATAHYVTADLDEGPIITQVTEPVDHSHSPEEMVRMGRHLEAMALTRAVRAHAERRVFLNGQRTVVLN